ncbi:MAG: hypothetical protein J6S76_01855 [Clostridia bacterium]|nr:hypothetical protein [Clostridia bacterium]
MQTDLYRPSGHSGPDAEHTVHSRRWQPSLLTRKEARAPTESPSVPSAHHSAEMPPDAV